MELAINSLDRTVTAQWWRRLVAASDQSSHWRTRTAYYGAVAALLARQSEPLSWRSIVGAVLPHGSRSTFYTVTGRQAKRSLIDALRGTPTVSVMHLALHYQRPAAVDQLVDETKVWSFWPYRERWRRQLAEGVDMAATTATGRLTSAVAEWASSHPGLAAALDNSPPLCAVEDLLTLFPDLTTASRAYRAMSQAVGAAVAIASGDRCALGTE